ncbi:hypothetical protein Tco_0206229 [Tanacetum coccineum]
MEESTTTRRTPAVLTLKRGQKMNLSTDVMDIITHFLYFIMAQLVKEDGAKEEDAGPDTWYSEGAPINPEIPTGGRREYIPSTDPSQESHVATLSTLDLITGNKVEFLLIIVLIEASYRLAHVALKVADEHEITVEVCVMCLNGLANGDARSKISLATDVYNFNVRLIMSCLLS